MKAYLWELLRQFLAAAFWGKHLVAALIKIGVFILACLGFGAIVMFSGFTFDVATILALIFVSLWIAAAAGYAFAKCPYSAIRLDHEAKDGFLRVRNDGIGNPEVSVWLTTAIDAAGKIVIDSPIELGWQNLMERPKLAQGFSANIQLFFVESNTAGGEGEIGTVWSFQLPTKDAGVVEVISFYNRLQVLATIWFKIIARDEEGRGSTAWYRLEVSPTIDGKPIESRCFASTPPPARN